MSLLLICRFGVRVAVEAATQGVGFRDGRSSSGSGDVHRVSGQSSARDVNRGMIEILDFVAVLFGGLRVLRSICFRRFSELLCDVNRQVPEVSATRGPKVPQAPAISALNRQPQKLENASRAYYDLHKTTQKRSRPEGSAWSRLFKRVFRDNGGDRRGHCQSDGLLG